MIGLEMYEPIEDKNLLLICASGSENIGRNLSNLRKEYDYSRVELANRIHVCLSTIAKYEEGTRIPDIDTLINISNVFEVDINKLIR